MNTVVNIAQARPIRVNIAAKRLNCSERTVRRRILNGEITATRLGLRNWTIAPADLDRYVARRASW